MRLIGRGRCADIYAWTPGRVLKLYQERFTLEWVERAAALGALVHEQGVPSPAIYGVEVVDGQAGMVLERLDGGTLFDRLISLPDQLEAIAADLAGLHVAIHERNVSGLPSRLDELGQRVAQAPGVDDDVRQRAQDALLRPSETRLVHGDLHPANVMVADDGSLVSIDWDGATEGPPAFDVARAWFLLHHWALAPGDFDVAAVERIRRPFADAYLEAYLERSTLTADDVEHWKFPAAVARLCEPIPEEELDVRADIVRLDSGSWPEP